MIAARVSRELERVGFALFAALLCLSSCTLETEPDEGLPGEIVRFDLLKADNPQLTQDAIGNIRGLNITLEVAADSDVTSLVPTVEYKGAELSPQSGVARDFSEPTAYAVTTPGGRVTTYTVSVLKAANSSKDIRRFLIDDVQGAINGDDITLTMPFGTDLTMLRASVIHSGVSVRPESGVFQDFSRPVEYVVTAQDGSTKTYTVIVSVAASDAKEITAFAIGDVSGEIRGTQITLALPFGTDVRELTPSITHTGTSLTPELGTAQDFRGPVTYTVGAADGTTQEYTVFVSVTPSSAKDITRFSVAGRTAEINGTAITLTLPYGTDLEHLTPNLQYTGKVLSPLSGVEQDFRGPVTYTVTAADGSTREYTVTLTVAANSAKEIMSFEILGSSAQINGTMITLTLPFGTSRAALAPTIGYTGESIDPQSGVARNFANPVSYVVTAADGTTRTYSVVVTVAPSDAKEITSFRLANVQAEIDNNAITVTVPFNTDITAIAPEITHNGESIDPPSGTRNFSTPQMYTVTAADSSTRTYTVTVTVARNSAKAITRFTLLGRNAAIDESTHTITLTVPFGNDVRALTPAIEHTGASVTPSGAQDFRQTVTYTVRAADDSTQDYSVTVTVAANDEKDITSFRILDMAASIGANTITLTVPNGTPLTSLTPTIVVSAGASVNPPSLSPRNFTSPVVYTVTADDNSTKMYTVTVTAALSSAKAITDFDINGVQGVFNGTAITVTLPFGTSRVGLMPAITISEHASINPPSGAAADFTNPVVYRVTAENNTFTDYTVTVNITAPATTKDILTFTMPGATMVVIGANTITVTMPHDTIVTSLAPTYTHNGASVDPISGSSHNFTQAVTYTVTAQDNSTRAYAVTVELSPPPPPP